MYNVAVEEVIKGGMQVLNDWQVAGPACFNFTQVVFLSPSVEEAGNEVWDFHGCEAKHLVVDDLWLGLNRSKEELEDVCSLNTCFEIFAGGKVSFLTSDIIVNSSLVEFVVGAQSFDQLGGGLEDSSPLFESGDVSSH